MVHLVKKEKKGNVYLYLAERGWVDGKSKQLWQIYLGAEDKLKKNSKIVIGDYETETIEFGLIAALLSVARKLNLVDIINQIAGKRQQGLSVGDHVLIAALNRCVRPCSKTQLQDWIDSTFLKDVYGNVETNIDSRAYWTHFQYLNEEKIEEIENYINRAVMDKFNIRYNDLTFDPTNFFTYINPRRENQELARHGHSKEGRATLNIINFSIFCSLESSVPLLHMVYPGNVQDVSHFREMALPRLERRLTDLDISHSTVTLAFDKGNLSPEAFKKIDEKGWKFICSDRPSSHKDLLGLQPHEFTMHTFPNGKEVGTKEFQLKKYDKIRRFIAVYNPKEAKWKQTNFKKKVSKKVDEIDEFFKTRAIFKPGEKRKGQGEKWRVLANVEKKVKAIIGNRHKDLINFTITGPDVLPIKDGGCFLISSKIDEVKLESALVELGKSFIMTNRDDLSAHATVWTYRQQYRIEQLFSWLKSPHIISTRPIYHWVDSSVRGHLFTCFIALLLLCLLVREVRATGPASIQKIIHDLKAIKITRLHIPGRKNPVDKVNKMSPDSRKLFDSLNLDEFLQVR